MLHNMLKGFIIPLILVISLFARIEATTDAITYTEETTEYETVTNTSCYYQYYGGCGSGSDWGSFYAIFVVGVGICFVFFFCAALGSLLLYATCRRLPTANGTMRNSSARSSLSISKPPPNFDEALKCSKVEYKVDVEDVPPPVYASLKF